MLTLWAINLLVLVSIPAMCIVENMFDVFVLTGHTSGSMRVKLAAPVSGITLK